MFGRGLPKWAFVAAASILSLFCLSDGFAQDKREPEIQTAFATAPAQAPIDTYILLKNQRILQGSVTRIGREVIIRRGDGSEMRLNQQSVIGWAESKRELFQFRVRHREALYPGSSVSVGSLLSDANWCLEHELLDLVIANLRRIQKIDPENRSATRLQKQLSRIVVDRRIAAQEPRPKLPTRKPEKVVQTAYQTQASTNTNGDSIDAQTLLTFARSVQPILLNRCASCHSQTSDLKLRFDVPSRGARPSARMTRHNLQVVSKFMAYEAPLQSELRMRALDGHAGAKNTLNVRGGATTAFDDWLSSARPPGAPLELAKQSYDDSEHDDSAVKTVGDSIATKPEVPKDNQNRPAARLPKVSNPFDPEIFNRRIQARNRK